MAICVAEIVVEADPIVVVGALGRRHLSPFQAPLKGYPRFSGNLLHRNMFGDTAHPGADLGEDRTGVWTAAS